MINKKSIDVPLLFVQVTYEICAAVVPGNMVEMTGMSKRFNRNAYVKHTSEADNWLTTATLGIGE